MANDPASTDKRLGDKPGIHRTASVRATSFGRWCEVGARTKVAESSFGDYSYVVNDSDIIYSTIGKFCSIAAHTRLNPGNHPLDRVMLSHVGYRSSAYGLGPDDPDFFEWRRARA
jgi:acetyltransferase-like isoleucine patch superfamily enzyme